MPLDALFTRYGSPSREADISLRGYLLRPDCLDQGKIVHYDDTAARLITEAQALIEQLNEYRAALAVRYGELETMPYTRRLTVMRELCHYPDRKVYRVIIDRVYQDGTTINELSESYPGQERHKALKRFLALQKEFPGIEAVKDIEKHQWER